jgi:predicted molibdopterin-dependent oxidoreductase YjgC
VTASGTPMADWRIATELALRLGADFDVATVEEVQDEIARIAPAHAGVGATLLRRARDGVVLPLHEHGDELVLDAGSLAITDMSWEPIRPGTIASEEGHASHVGTGVVEATGTGSTTTVKPGLTEKDAPAANGVEVAEVAAAAAAAAAQEPGVYRWDRRVEPPRPVAHDAYSLRLVTTRKLYDGGRVVTESPSLAPLAPGAALLVHRKDFDRIGVNAGELVEITTNRGTVQLPVQPEDGVPEGVAVIPFAQPGDGAADIIDVTAAVTDIRVTTVKP